MYLRRLVLLPLASASLFAAPPSAVNDSVTTAEDTPIVRDAATGLRANDTAGTATDPAAGLVTSPAHGTVVATSYGIPSISMSTTDKNRNLMRRLGRPDLVCAFDDPRLADRLTNPPAPIDLAVRDAMARQATASLARLRERILAD